MNEIYKQIEERIKNKAKKPIISSTILGTLMVLFIIYLSLSNMKGKAIPISFAIMMLLFFIVDIALTISSNKRTISELYKYCPNLINCNIQKIGKKYVIVSIPDTDTTYRYVVIETNKKCDLEINKSVCYLSYQSYMGITSKTEKVLVSNGTIY